MRVYHFLNEAFGLEDIELRRIKIARINELNDPFEMLSVDWDQTEYRAAHQRMLEVLSETTGMLCFSRTWKNPVQWSHYADRHFGICLGFEVPARQLRPVKYRTTRIRPELLRMIFHQEYQESFMEDVLSSKFSHWRYEQEMRSFVKLDKTTEQNGLYFINFSDELHLSEVIVGVKSQICRKKIDSALGELSGQVKCRKARLAFHTFNVVEQRKASLWT